MAPLDSLGRPQTVLLLGARSGIGRAVVSRMVSDGAGTVILAGRGPGDEWRPGSSAKVEYLDFEATDTSTHRRFFADLFDRKGTIDVVLFAFGVLHDQSRTEADPELAVEMAEVNYVGAMSGLLHASAHLRKQGSGVLVVLSSVAGVVPRGANFSYGSTKAGLDFMARGLARRLEGSEVRVLVVRPGFVHTAMTANLPTRPLAVGPDAVADAIAEGLARRREVIWVPPILRWVMLLVRLLPGWAIDRLGG